MHSIQIGTVSRHCPPLDLLAQVALAGRISIKGISEAIMRAELTAGAHHVGHVRQA